MVRLSVGLAISWAARDVSRHTTDSHGAAARPNSETSARMVLFQLPHTRRPTTVCRALLHRQLPRPMHLLEMLLLDRLHPTNCIPRRLYTSANPVRVVDVVLVGVGVRRYLVWAHHQDLVTQVQRQLCPAKAIALHQCPSFIYSLDMENCLCQINTYSINISHGSCRVIERNAYSGL